MIDSIKRLKKPHDPWKKYYKKNDRAINVPNISLYAYLKDCMQNYKQLPALEYFGNIISYEQFDYKIEICARALISYGIGENDVITICMANTPEAVIAFFAVNKIGAIANMIHPLSAKMEIKNYLIDNHSKMLLALDSVYEKINDVIDETNVIKTVIISPAGFMPLKLSIFYWISNGRKVKKPSINDDRFVNWKDFYSAGKKYNLRDSFVFRGKDDPAVILHSGGTTGQPKGIVLSNGAFNAFNLQAKIFLTKFEPGDSVLTILPLFHGFGLGVSTIAPLSVGAKVMLRPQFNSRKFDELIDKTKPNLVFGVPTLYEALTRCHNVKNLDLSYIKYIISGGDYLSSKLENKLNNYLYNHNCREKIAQGYGMTECLAAVGVAFGDCNKPGSIGIPLPGNYFKIVNPDTLKPLGPYEDGEICINGPTVMLGYLDNEVATNDMLRIHDDGFIWLHTGDIGYMDEDGVFFYKQRLKRMIVSSGYNVYPSYIENIILQHPAVFSCTVIGIPHSYKQEVPKAFIVLKSDYIGINVKNSIKRFCEKHLSKHSIPYEFEFRKSLPKTMIGKTDFKKLIQEEKEKRGKA